ncbi:DbpA RNA binding domain-containing protein, partial [Bacillus cereus group sp. Bce020]
MDMPIEPAQWPDMSGQNTTPYQANMVTIQIDGGKKQKVRPGDILGALTSDDGIDGQFVGKINVLPMRAYVAVHKSVAKRALKKMETGKMK